MLEAWESAVISTIALAIHVRKSTGRIAHNNRPFHGFVLNDADSDKNYIFSDGRTLRTKPNSFFYLPKGSSYRVEEITRGTCYAINFDATLTDEPFAIEFRNPEPLFKLFKSAVSLFAARAPFYEVEIRKILYELLLRAKEEAERKYVPESKERLLAPAVERIRETFTQNELSVSALASLCGISEAYFRRLFSDKYGLSPKDYIIHLRMELAKTLLSSGDFSVRETALQCGYAEPCHFSREFTRHVGLSPRSYKNGG
jgi:AraC-like DNA-binding protein